MSICIAENLRILRQKNDYTLEQLAEIIDVSRQTVAKWEAGETMPDIVNCVKLAAIFKVTLDEFVTMPIRNMNSEMNTDGNVGHVMGVIDVGGEGQINIPDSVLKLFDIKAGEKVLLLADEKQGIAIVKCSQF